MSVVVENGNSVFSGNGSSWSTAAGAGSNSDRYIAVAAAAVSASPTGATYAGASLSSVGNDGQNIWYDKVNNASGSNTLAVSFSAYGSLLISWATFSGVDQGTPRGSLATNSGSSNAPTISATCPSGGVIYGSAFSGYVSGGAPTITSGTLLGATRDSGSGFTKTGGYRTTTGAVSWSLGGSVAWWASALPLNQVAVAASTNPNPRTILQAVKRASFY